MVTPPRRQVLVASLEAKLSSSERPSSSWESHWLGASMRCCCCSTGSWVEAARCDVRVAHFRVGDWASLELRKVGKEWKVNTKIKKAQDPVAPSSAPAAERRV